MNKQITLITSIISSAVIFILSLVFYFVLRHKYNIQYILVFYLLIASGISLAGIITYNYLNYKVGEMFHIVSSLFLGLFFLDQSLTYNLFASVTKNNFLTMLICIVFDLSILANIFMAVYPRVDKSKLKIEKRPKSDFMTVLFGGITSGLGLLLLLLYLSKNLVVVYIARLFLSIILILGSTIVTYLYDLKLGKILSLAGFIMTIFLMVNVFNDITSLFVWYTIKVDFILVLFQTLIIGSYMMYLSFLFFKNEEIEVTILDD